MLFEEAKADDRVDNGWAAWAASRESLLAGLLAWAVERNIPFHQAIATLPECRLPPNPSSHASKAVSWLKRPLCLPGLGGASWSSRLAGAVGDLERGALLAGTLKKWFGKFLSPYYLAAVDKAEQDQTLPVVLPVLAAKARRSAAAGSQVRGTLIYPVSQASVVLTVLFVVILFSIQKFDRIFFEVRLGHSHVPPLFQALLSVSNMTSWFAETAVFKVLSAPVLAPTYLAEFLTRKCSLPFFVDDLIVYFMIFLQIFFLIVVPLLYLWLVLKAGAWLLRPCRHLAAAVFAHLPLVGRCWRKRALFELAGAMEALLEAGYDLPAAARWNAAAVANPWLKRKLAKFADAVDAGVFWGDAWSRMRLGAPAHDWIISQASGRDNPLQGFRTLAGVLAAEVNGGMFVFLKFLEAFCILLNAALVGVFAIAFWQALCALIWSLV